MKNLSKDHMQNPRELQSTKISYWIWILAALPLLAHTILLLQYSVNAPRLDDFSDGLTLLPLFYATDSLAEKFKILFTLYQNHRWGLLHGIYFAFRCIDFRVANFFSLLPLTAMPLLWLYIFRKENYAGVALIIASAVVFNLQAWTGMFWITASLTAIPVVPLALLAFILITKDSWPTFYLAVITALVATFTNGNGILLWPIIFAYLLYQIYFSDRKNTKVKLLMWACISATIIFLYFSHSVLSHEIPGSNISGSFSKSLENPLLFAQGALAGIGSIATYHTGGNFEYKLTLSLAIGCIEILAMGWLLLHGALRQYPSSILFAFFILGTTAAIAATRASFIGIEQAFQGHYKLYNGTFLLILITAALDYFLKKNPVEKNNRTACFTLVFFCFSLYTLSATLFIPDINEYHRSLTADTRNWLHNHALQRGETRLLVKKPNQKLGTAVAGGYYNPWTLIEKNNRPAETSYQDSCQNSGEKITTTAESHKLALAVHIQLETPSKHSILLLCSPLQSLKITLKDYNYLQGVNGAYSAELWVARNPLVTEDEGPWSVHTVKHH